MPEMDGFGSNLSEKFANEKINNSGLHTAIVALTAHAMKGDRERCLEAGMDGYLSKPIRATELDEVLDSYIAGKSESQRAPEPVKQIT